MCSQELSDDTVVSLTKKKKWLNCRRPFLNLLKLLKAANISA